MLNVLNSTDYLKDPSHTHSIFFRAQFYPLINLKVEFKGEVTSKYSFGTFAYIRRVFVDLLY